MSKTTLNLLMGNLWNLDTSKLVKLRSQFNLPDTQLSRLKFTPQAPLPARDEAVQMPPPRVTAVEMPKPLATTPTTMQAPKFNLATFEAQRAQKTGEEPPPAPPQLLHDWQQLINQVSGCEECKLCYGRTQVVIERGNRQARWMFVGEGPGAQEDLQGKPFVGASGQLLDKMINAMKLDPQNDIYIANVIKCRPPHNRNPEADEIQACQNYLLSQIELVKPQIIITLGRYAAQALLNTDIAVGKLRKRVHQFKEIPLIVTYHPSYLLRTPEAKRDAWEDLQLAMRTFAGCIN